MEYIYIWNIYIYMEYIYIWNIYIYIYIYGIYIYMEYIYIYIYICMEKIVYKRACGFRHPVGSWNICTQIREDYSSEF
jgi:hypothetical protein